MTSRNKKPQSHCAVLTFGFRCVVPRLPVSLQSLSGCLFASRAIQDCRAGQPSYQGIRLTVYIRRGVSVSGHRVKASPL